jgi:hypothetical protein
MKLTHFSPPQITSYINGSWTMGQTIWDKKWCVIVNVLGEHIENLENSFGNMVGTHWERPNPKKLSDRGRLAAARLPVQRAASMCDLKLSLCPTWPDWSLNQHPPVHHEGWMKNDQEGRRQIFLLGSNSLANHHG